MTSLHARQGLIIFFALLVCVSALRVACCLQLPANTGDVLRHARYGLLVKEVGPWAAELPLVRVNPDFARVCWSTRPFIYTPLTLLFDTLVMCIYPTIFSLKFALTLLEALGAYIIYRHTGEKWLALIYWASPVSIWWASHEGQFEPLENVLVIAAIYFLYRRRALAWLCLMLAIQVKLFPFLLLPFFVWADRKLRPMVTAKNVAFAAVGFLPTGIGALIYSPMEIFHVGVQYNPYYWNFFRADIFGWNPPWLIVTNQIASYGALIMLLYLAYRSTEKAAYLAPLGFAFLCKVLTRMWGLWYMMVIPTLLLPIREKRVRFFAFLLAPLLEITSLVQIVAGPFGFVVNDYYAGLTALSIILPFQ